MQIKNISKKFATIIGAGALSLIATLDIMESKYDKQVMTFKEFDDEYQYYEGGNHVLSLSWSMTDEYDVYNLDVNDKIMAIFDNNGNLIDIKNNF